MRIAITTPAGNIGSKIVEQLQAQTRHELFLLCRDPDSVAAQLREGAVARIGSLEDIRFVERATADSDALFWLTPPNYAARDFRAWQENLGRNVANAMRINGIPRVVNLSSFGAQAAYGAGPISGLHDVETLIDAAAADTGAAVTHLRPAFFQENFLMFAPSIMAMGSIFMPVAPSTRTPMIATQDIADVAARLLGDKSWNGHHVRELLGPRDYTFNEATEIIGRALGRPVQYVQIKSSQAAAAMEEMGATPNVAASFIEMYRGLESGLITPLHPRSKESTTPTTLEDFVAKVLAPAVKAVQHMTSF
ncbi:MAG: NmrA family NAD(P)-binding protein [Planctomycetes bacterium]|nr:NmrA family NAD(P)-binding protein [Planctomycetota bacterium]